jgi:hypothetical protein
MSELKVNKVTPRSGTTVTLGDSGDTITIPSGATFSNSGTVTGITQGITMADQWRLTADITTDADITSNLERVDEDSSGFIGTGMTESSGIFSFPSTGIYSVRMISVGTANINDNITINMLVTINNSTYNGYTISNESGDAGSGSATMVSEAIIDVTDVSNVKVKFNVSSLAAGSEILGSTSVNYTYFTFIRLGDT